MDKAPLPREFDRGKDGFRCRERQAPCAAAYRGSAAGALRGAPEKEAPHLKGPGRKSRQRPSAAAIARAGQASDQRQTSALAPRFEPSPTSVPLYKLKLEPRTIDLQAQEHHETLCTARKRQKPEESQSQYIARVG